MGMKDRAVSNPKLSREERDMLSAAYKNSLSERRMAIRTIQHSCENEFQQNLASGYHSKVNAELVEICDQVTQLLNNTIIPGNASDQEPEAMSFYYKMLGDYYRYLT